MGFGHAAGGWRGPRLFGGGSGHRWRGGRSWSLAGTGPVSSRGGRLVPVARNARLAFLAIARNASRAFLEDGQQFADLDVLAFLPLDARDDAGAVGIHLEIDFFGLEFHVRLAELDAIAFLLQPAGHARLDDRLTQFRDTDVGHRP